MKRVSGVEILVFFVGIFLHIQCYSQNLGIGTDLPTHALDVNGKTRMRVISNLDSNSRKVFVTAEGELVNKPDYVLDTEIYSSRFTKTNFLLDGIGKYNRRELIIFPLAVADSDVNTLDLEKGAVLNTLKIKKDGYYLYSGFFNFYLATKKNSRPEVPPEDPLGFSVSIGVSKDSGKTWADSFSAIVYKTVLPTENGSIVTVRLPPNVYNHKAGDLIRVEILRLKYVDSPTFGLDLKGTPVNFSDIEVTNRNGVIPYRLTIIKK